jgi:pimeloyl-ACP methyl ester carboxylesterase
MAHAEKSTNVRSSFEHLAPLRKAVHTLERISPTLAARLAQELFTTPRRHPRPTHERALLDRATERFAIARSRGALRAWAWGDGPTILLAHGWEGRGSQLGAFVDPLVARGFRVVAFDAPAHGDSVGWHTNLVEVAGAILDVANREGRLAGIVAHSLGAAATTIAIARGAEVDRAVYLAPMFAVERTVRGFAQLVGLSPDAGDRFVAGIEARTATPVGALEGAVHAPRIAAPLLVVHDEDDREVAIAHAEGLVAFWPDARLRRTKGLGHRRIVRDEETVAAGTTFLADGQRHLRSPREILERELFDRDARNGRSEGSFDRAIFPTSVFL